MEDLNKMLELSESLPRQLEEMSEDFLLKLRVILWGDAAIMANKQKMKNVVLASPQQIMKRVKRLSLLNEDNEGDDKEERLAVNGEKSSPRKSRRSNDQLLAAAETIDVNTTEIATPTADASSQSKLSTSNKERETIATLEDVRISEGTILMPPPAARVVASVDSLNKRPQRAAKLKSEKNLKEATLKSKIRRPTVEVKVKLEHEQRSSQIHESTTQNELLAKCNDEDALQSSVPSQKPNDSVVIIPQKSLSIVSINSDTEDISRASGDKQTLRNQTKNSDSIDNGTREIRIKIKREKISLNNQESLPVARSDEAVFKAPMPVAPLPRNEEKIVEETSILSSTTNNSSTVPAKKTRKKKDIVHKPIKVERFSDEDAKPIAARTRHGSLNKSGGNESSPKKVNVNERPASIYEDAVEAPPTYSNTKESNGVVNETVNLGSAPDSTITLGPAPSDATFCSNPARTTLQIAPCQTTFVMDSNPNATVTLSKNAGADAVADATFDVQSDKYKDDDTVGHRSFQTARDSSMPNDNSLMTEDEDHEKPMVTETKVSTPCTKDKGAIKRFPSAKATYKVPTRQNELFNPLIQSPVKLRVEAFENAAAAANEQAKRPLRNKKENLTPSSVTTPVIGKLAAPALGRFLTPTQSSNIAAISNTKKVTTSASKALSMTKTFSASSLQRSNSTASTAKNMQRENSSDDFRKGLHNLAEERKRIREQKHLLAAQQREAKERERAERMAKLAKDREEKRVLKKQQEQEQKKRELDEIQRKLRQQQDEEIAKMKAAKDREIALQMKQQQQLAKQRMMPPPPKITLRYTFEMLHEDDSTDDEDKVSYKRPPPPSWSRSHARGPAVVKQEYTPSAFIDSFFSVRPMTPDLSVIFPNIDARHLKRNSSVLWSTPPRYSELPKY